MEKAEQVQTNSNAGAASLHATYVFPAQFVRLSEVGPRPCDSSPAALLPQWFSLICESDFSRKRLSGPALIEFHPIDFRPFLKSIIPNLKPVVTSTCTSMSPANYRDVFSSTPANSSIETCIKPTWDPDRPLRYNLPARQRVVDGRSFCVVFHRLGTHLTAVCSGLPFYNFWQGKPGLMA